MDGMGEEETSMGSHSRPYRMGTHIVPQSRLDGKESLPILNLDSGPIEGTRRKESPTTPNFISVKIGQPICIGQMEGGHEIFADLLRGLISNAQSIITLRNNQDEHRKSFAY